MATIITDGGGEYCSKEFKKYIINSGVIHQKTIPKTPNQKGVSERKNMTLMEIVRCMLSDSKVPKKFLGGSYKYSKLCIEPLSNSCS